MQPNTFSSASNVKYGEDGGCLFIRRNGDRTRGNGHR